MGRGLEESRVSQHMIACINHYHMQTISLPPRLAGGFFFFFCPSEALLLWSANFKVLAKQRGVICLPCTRISSAGPLSGGRVSLHRFVNPKYQGEEFPGGPGVKTLCFHCRRRRAQSLVGEPHLGSHRAMSLSAPSSSPISPPLAWVVHPTAANG